MVTEKDAPHTGEGTVAENCLFADGTAMECGEDEAGAICGTCPPGVPCVNHICLCEPDCQGKECGPDGCGSWCGAGDGDQGCYGDTPCIDHECIDCQQDCFGKECGFDGCGGSCGSCPCADCDDDEVHCEAGQCIAEGGTQNDCPDIFACFDTCDSNDQPCYIDCLNAASVEGQLAYNNLVTCLDETGYFDCPANDDECYTVTFEPCYDVYFECFHGDKTCVEMYICYVQCPEGPDYDQCSSSCFSDAQVEAQQLWYEIMDCLEESGYYECDQADSECYDTTWEMCEDLYQECVHGDFTCGQIIECYGECESWDDTCYGVCYANGSIEAQDLYGEMLTCVELACGGWGDPDCQEEAMQGPCADLSSECYAP